MEVRCPMCAKLNPEGADECEHCGARITPLVIGDEGTSRAEEVGREEEDWLSRIRDQASQEQDQPAGQAEPSEEDWLGRLREASSETPEEEPLSPERHGDYPATDPDEGKEMPEWLARIRAREAEEVEEPSAVQDDDWLENLRGAAPLDDEGPEELAAEDQPSEEEGDMSPETPPPQEMEFPTGEDREAEIPGWLEASEERQPDAPLPAEEESRTPDLFTEEGAEQEPVSAADEPDSQPFIQDSPSWLQEIMEETSEARKRAEREEVEPSRPVSPTDIEGEPEEPEPEPTPHIPALIFDDEEREGSEFDSGEIDLEGAQLPEWLGEVELEERGVEGEEVEEGEGDLAPATLPTWLEAMRPVDTFQSVVEIETEEDESIESVGPLAGLRGVLMAEPVVAKPRTSPIGSMQLSVTERQYAQAELLNRLVAEEQDEVRVRPEMRLQSSLLRWLMAIIMLLGVAVPTLFGTPSYPLPRFEPVELKPMVNLITRLPADRPILMVFDYDPGYSGELDAVAGPLIDQVMRQGISIASLSTRPTGSAMAVRLLGEIGQQYDYVSGEQLIHMGYLSGGPTAVQLLALAPRSAILQGFNLPAGLQAGGSSVWDTPALREVHELSDFGMVAVISAGTDNARMWAEQAAPRMADTPLVMILSAGSEPMIRPYFEAREPQIQGILSGLPAAVAYEQRNNQVGAAHRHWSAFGSGLMVAELALAGGMVYGVVIWFLRRQ